MTLGLDRPLATALFDSLDRQPPDALLAVIGLHRADPRPDKIDVGVGVYRDAAGATPVMRAVKAAEARLLAGQDSKSYLGAEGDQRYTDLLATVALGDTLAADPRITGIQTPGGTGALRLAAELIARSGKAPTIWIGTPTWPNHGPIFANAFADVRCFEQYDPASQRIRAGAILEAMARAAPGDVFILHGCCHNPTGVDPDAAEWAAIGAMAEQRGLLPIIDIAYHGFGDGLDLDLAPLRMLLDALPAALIAYSCSKNFGLYRDRVGALFVAADAAIAEAAWSNLLLLARTSYSMPPDHGAAIVGTILRSPVLEADWRRELESYRLRLRHLRGQLAAAGRIGEVDLAPLATQKGFFSMLPLRPQQVDQLRRDHGIYMAQSGRINIAGLSDRQIPAFVAALASLAAE